MHKLLVHMDIERKGEDKLAVFSKKHQPKCEKELIMTKEVPFAVEEAYKSLRTSLVFSLPEDTCKIIEITSSTQNEGKSITSINLAISLAKNGERVILLDCDLRLPTVAKKLKISQKPGLTNYLFDLNSIQDVIYTHPSGIDVIPTGDIPPNPSETLGSMRMTAALEYLKNHYDYVILDAPPVGLVTDAAVLAPKVSGVVLVVRQGVAYVEGVDAAINKLRMANGKIIGFVLTDSSIETKNYSHYRYFAPMKVPTRRWRNDS